MRPDEWLQQYHSEGVGGVLPLMPIAASLQSDNPSDEVAVVRAAVVHGFSAVVAASVGVNEPRMWWWHRSDRQYHAALLSLDAGCTYAQMWEWMRESFWFRPITDHEDNGAVMRMYRQTVVTQVGGGCPAYLVGPNDLDEFLNRWASVTREPCDPDDRVWSVLSELTGWPVHGLQQIVGLIRG